YDVKKTSEGRKDPLVSQFNDVEKIFQWHGDTFNIPEGAVRLAASKSCVNQAYRYGNKVYGFQFHLEVDQQMIERWLLNPENKNELKELTGVIDPDQIKNETPKYIDNLIELSNNTFTKFIGLFGNIVKRGVLPSR
ncbi:MAG: type 1 glutamine amidotransferase, partial [Thermodesulfobacteriota bacterium]